MNKMTMNTKFKKGQIPWNKGKQTSLDARRKQSIAHIGKPLSEAHRKAIGLNSLGNKYRLGTHHTPEWKKQISQMNTGKNIPEEIRKKISHTCKIVYNSENIKRQRKEARAKQIFPVKDTSIETKIQNFLQQLEIEYFAHKYMNIEHAYQCDILIPSMNMVIECDGNYWHSYPAGKDIDHIRTKELIEKGFKVLRFWESDIKSMDLKAFNEKLKGGIEDKNGTKSHNQLL